MLLKSTEIPIGAFWPVAMSIVPQTPALHAAPPQECPQVSQFDPSSVVSQPCDGFVEQCMKPGVHAKTHVLFTHVGALVVFAAPHAVLHAPQFATSVTVLVSQPFEGSPSQSANPVGQVGFVQLPPSHVAPSRVPPSCAPGPPPFESSLALLTHDAAPMIKPTKTTACFFPTM